MALSFLALFIILAAALGSAAVIGFLGYLFSRLRRLEGGAFDRPGPYQLSDQVTGMAEEILALQEEVSNLSERLEFTEKLLMGGRKDSTSEGSE